MAPTSAEPASATRLPLARGPAEAAAVLWRAAGGGDRFLPALDIRGGGELPSVFAVSDLAAAATAAVGLAVAEYRATAFGGVPAVTVDRRLSSLWFGTSLKPQGWALPPAWDPVAGDYAARDGWVRLHTNAPHHRDAALAVLGVAAGRAAGRGADRAAVAGAVAGWQADALEAAVVERGGCAAAMRDLDGWRRHPQGQAVAAEPLLWCEALEAGPAVRPAGTPARPLAGVRVLDLTRVLAGPVATRFLAGFGAEVLRLDPPGWDEPAVLPEVTPGKRRARLDLRDPGGRARFAELLSGADLLVHGYRPDALDRLGLDAAARREIRPGLIDVSLAAYGWTGPWCLRRGFDSLVQMSSGIAAEGMRRHGADRPQPLPVQALDHAAGCLLATAALRGLTRRLLTGRGSRWRSSLARVAALLVSLPGPQDGPLIEGPARDDFADRPEATGWGPALRLKPPLSVEGAALRWDRPAGPLGIDDARW
ncbi:CoA transferase [Azospirillum thermophilum]|uniref:Acyl-CoA transferase n=1 Tax=Azospirillum thermophilum TaxID=2202148 RepID=A0A2S2CW90_9PROT|nr:CoA transferase [Azospirillum thermophilum]AWK88793.1 acyl-CoA transferase [Azospirillum thermophilum]